MASVREMPLGEQNEILRDARNLAEEGDYEGASKIAFQVLERAPNSAMALHLLGYIYLMIDRQVMAYQFYRRALQVDSRHAEIWNNFGRAADELHLYEESEAAFKRTLQIDPQYAAGWANLSVSLINQARYKEALVAAEKAIELDPEAKNGWINIGFASLALGDWKRGWAGYHKALGGKFRQPVCYGDEPEWDGKPVDCLVVTGEQGIGDEVNFAQMIRDAAKDCGSVVYDCHPRLVGLFRRSFEDVPNVHVYGTRKEQAVPWLADHKPSAHISLADLGMFYRQSDESFPRQAYIKADPERVLQWRALFDSWGKPVIGIAWSGGNFLTQSVIRNVTAKSFKPLIDAVDAVFVSLEYKDPSAEIRASGLPIKWFERATMPKDYDETAGLVGACDAIVGIHTSALHLAGAMGKPVRCLVPDVPQWRYNRDDMPWYPDFKLYRKCGLPWEAAIAKIAREEFAGRKAA